MRLLVKIKPDETLSNDEHKLMGGVRKRYYGDEDINVHLVEANDISEYQANPKVIRAEIDEGSYIPVSRINGLKNSTPTRFEKVTWNPLLGTQQPSAMLYPFSKSGVVIFEIGNGVSSASVPNLLPGWDANLGVASSAQPWPSGSLAMHDNEVGMTIWAATNGAISILPIQITSASNPAYAYWSVMASAITWAANYCVANKVRGVANLSWGVFDSTNTLSSAISSAIAYADSCGLLVNLCAMDSGVTVTANPAETLALCITGVDQNGNPYETNYLGSGLIGGAAYSFTYNQDGWYGTSFAIAYWTAAAALILGLQPTITTAALRAMLLKSYTLLSNPTLGVGMLNMLATITLAESGSYTPPAPIPAPTVTITATSSSIVSGQSTTLSWTDTNTTSLSINGTTVTGNSLVVSPTITTSYTITATGAGGIATANVTITVTSPAPPPSGGVPTNFTIHQSSTTNLMPEWIDPTHQATVWIQITPSGGIAKSYSLGATNYGTCMAGFIGFTGQWPTIPLAAGTYTFAISLDNIHWSNTESLVVP